MLFRPPQIHFFISGILDWILTYYKEWGGMLVVGLLPRSLAYLFFYLCDISAYKYVPKSRRRVTYKLYSKFNYTIKPIILQLLNYKTLVMQYDYWFPEKRKPPTERRAIAQRPKKNRTRFYYRRTKKGGQVCSPSATMPSRLRKQVIRNREAAEIAAIVTNTPTTTSKRGCRHRATR
jgi:hypothetical protein